MAGGRRMSNDVITECHVSVIDGIIDREYSRMKDAVNRGASSEIDDEEFEPRGKYLAECEGGWLACDNSTGDAFCEEYKKKEVAVLWLLDIIDTDEAHEIDDRD